MAHKTKVRGGMCAVLHLVLKKKWFDMIDSLEKRVEYRTSENVIRQIDRWYGRSLIHGLNLVVVFHDGYRRGRRSVAFFADPPRLKWKSDNPEWGEPDCEHYSIPLVGGGIELV